MIVNNRWTWMALSIFGAVVPFCQAEDSKNSPSPMNDEEVRILSLAHSKAGTMFGILNLLPLEVRAAVADDTTLLVHGKKLFVDRVEELVKKLDAPETAKKANLLTEYISLGNVEMGTLNRSLDALIGGTPTRVAIDTDNHMLVVRGGEHEVHAIRNLVKRLDHSPKSYTLHFYFLRAGPGPLSKTEDGTLPADLKPAATALAASGFANLQLLTPLMLVADEGRPFESNAEFNRSAEGDTLDRLTIHVQGVARPMPYGDAMQINLEASVNGQYKRGGKDEGKTMFNVKNTVVTKLGNYAVIAAAPGSTAAGDSIALVVRVTTE